MELEALIRGRRSVRKYNHTPVSKQLVAELLNSAVALSGSVGNESLPGRYLYAGSMEARQRLAGYLTEQVTQSRLGRLIPGKLVEMYKKKFTDIPAHLIVICDKDPQRSKSESIYAEACAVLQNFQLLAWERGLGMVWDTEPMIQTDAFFKGIGITEQEKFVGIFHIGYFDKSPRGRARTSAEKKWTTAQDKDLVQEQATTRQPVPQELVLELLNHAVWAPNDGLREPWRFIFAEEGYRELMPRQGKAAAYLVIVMPEDSDLNKQNEDFAAVACLVQNFVLLGREKGLQVVRTMNEWIYDRKYSAPFGVQASERIAAVLELDLVDVVNHPTVEAHFPDLVLEGL
ncbi:nitroreductase family protein [Paenibacillus sp. GCM10012306]|uniref:nitroreductase family protein n=1 Tax=Paenibacillus sp. GCM10012306 TaxID=3317342 RepID=UPI00361B8F41